MEILEISQIIFNITVSTAIIVLFIFFGVIAFSIFQSVRTIGQFVRQCKKEYEILLAVWKDFFVIITSVFSKKSKKPKK